MAFVRTEIDAVSMDTFVSVHSKFDDYKASKSLADIFPHNDTHLIASVGKLKVKLPTLRESLEELIRSLERCKDHNDESTSWVRTALNEIV